MFNETTFGDSTPYKGPTYPSGSPFGFSVPNNPCPPGQVLDYDPATQSYSNECVDNTQAYQQGPMKPSSETFNIGGSNNWLWIGMIGLALVAGFFGGRR